MPPHTQQQPQPQQHQPSTVPADQQQQRPATGTSTSHHGSGFFIVAGSSDIRQLILKHIGNAIAALHYASLAGLAQQGISLDPNTGAPTAPISPAHVTPFFSASSPGLALSAYSQRLVDMSTYGYDGLAYALVLLGRYVKITGRLPSMLTVHRQVLTCLLAAMKCNSDLFYKNKFLSRVGGVPLTEVNRMEAHLMQVLNFSAGVTDVELRGVLCDMGQCGAARTTDIMTCFQAMTRSVQLPPLLQGQVPVAAPHTVARTGPGPAAATPAAPAVQPEIDDSDDDDAGAHVTRHGHHPSRTRHHRQVPLAQAQ